MIHIGSIQSLWSKHKDELIKFYLGEQNKPVQWVNLKPMEFTDTKGKRYARFPQDMALPVSRLAQLMLYYQYLSKGLSAEEDASIDDEIEATLMQGVTELQKNGIKKVSGSGWYAKVLSLINERRKRKELTSHVQLFYHILAVQIVREDESLTEFDQEIQNEKVMEFANNETPERAMFFFQQPELKNLTGLSKMSIEDVTILLAESKREQDELKAKIQLIRDFKASNNTSQVSQPTGTNP